jgi:hypothetical protein
MHVQAAVAGAREEMMKELYILNQKNGLCLIPASNWRHPHLSFEFAGYSSDFTTFKGKADLPFRRRWLTIEPGFMQKQALIKRYMRSRTCPKLDILCPS